jgi:hypothetical protein
MFVYTYPIFAWFSAASSQQTSFWALRKVCLDSDIPLLMESRLSNLRGTKSGGNSKKNKSDGSNGFSSNLSTIVQEESDEVMK